MHARTYAVAEWPDSHKPSVVDLALLPEAKEYASSWAVIVAVSRRHALRLYAECAEAIRGSDGRLERFGIVEGAPRR